MNRRLQMILALFILTLTGFCATQTQAAKGFRYYKLEFTATQGAGVIQLQEIDLLDAEGNPIESMKVYKDSYGQGDRLGDNDMGTKWGGGFDGYAYVLMDTAEPATLTGYRFYTGDDTESQSGRNPRSWKLYGCNAETEPDVNAEWTLLDERTDDNTMQAVNLTPFDFMLPDETEKGFRYYKLEFTATQGADVIQLEEIDLLDSEGNPIESMKVYKDSFGKGEGTHLSDNSMETKWGGGFGGYAYVLMDTEEPITIGGYRFYTGDDTASQPGRNPRSWKLYGCNADSEPDENAEWTLIDERKDDNTLQPVNLTPFDFMLVFDYNEAAYQAYESSAQEIIALLSGSEGLGNEWDMLKSYLEETTEPGNPFPNGSYPYIMANRQLTANEVYQEIEYLQELYKKAQNDVLLPGYRYYKLEFTANMGDPVIQLEEIDLLDADGNPIETMKVYKDTFGQGARLSDNNMGTKWGGGFSGYAYVLMSTGLPTTPAGYRFYTGDDTEACPGRNPKSWKLYGCFSESDPDENANWTLIDERTDDESIQPVNLTPFDFFFEYEYTIEPAFEVYQAYEEYAAQIVSELVKYDIEGEAIDLLRAYLDEKSEPGNPFPNGSYPYIMANMKLTAGGVRQEMAYLQSLFDAAQNDPAWPGFRYFILEFTATQGAGIIQLQEIDLLDAEGNPIESAKVYMDSYNEGKRLSDNDMTTKWGGGFGGYAYVLIDAGQKVMPKSYRLYTGDDTQTQSGRNPRSWRMSAGNVYTDTPEGGEWTVMDEHIDDYTMQPVSLTPFDFAISYIYTEEERIAKAYEDYKAYAAELLATMNELEATGDAAELLYNYIIIIINCI